MGKKDKNSRGLYFVGTLAIALLILIITNDKGAAFRVCSEFDFNICCDIEKLFWLRIKKF